jgi:predicted lactoylglutathione lyase
MVISDDIYAMLLTHAKFKEFTKKAVADTSTSPGSTSWSTRR